jgi:hypothetical protein
MIVYVRNKESLHSSQPTLKCRSVLQAIILVIILAYGKEEFASEVFSSEK